MRKILLSLVFFALSAVAASTTVAKPALSAGAKPPAHPHISDADLERAIRARFAKSKISTDKFTAHAQGGVATLEGHTDVVQHKGTATRLAKNAGALAVVNNIEIGQAAKDKAAANLESGRRRAQVKRGDLRSQ